jgi:hypothetical protein
MDTSSQPVVWHSIPFRRAACLYTQRKWAVRRTFSVRRRPPRTSVPDTIKLVQCARDGAGIFPEYHRCPLRPSRVYYRLPDRAVAAAVSDVNYYLFQILPRLKPGVIIHIHDMFWPFEYLAEWVLADNRSWNEAYLMHAFLQYNDAFEILYWNNYAFHFMGAELEELMPLSLGNEGGSLWIRKKPR